MRKNEIIRASELAKILHVRFNEHQGEVVEIPIPVGFTGWYNSYKYTHKDRLTSLALGNEKKNDFYPAIFQYLMLAERTKEEWANRPTERLRYDAASMYHRVSGLAYKTNLLLTSLYSDINVLHMLEEKKYFEPGDNEDLLSLQKNIGLTADRISIVMRNYAERTPQEILASAFRFDSMIPDEELDNVINGNLKIAG